MSENNFRQFIASSELFSGYEVMIDLNKCNSIDDIVNTFYDNLYNCLTLHNFRILLEAVRKCKFHIHSYTFEDILTSAEDSAYYVCDHS